MESPVGSLLLGATEEGVCLVEFGDRRAIEAQVRDLRRRMECAVVPGMNRHLVALRRQLEEYFGGRRKKFELPLVYPGTPFQQRVWECLLTIPYGATWSYEELSKAAGRPGAQRAAGSANGKNRIAIVIPCPRVVNKGGKIGGYGGGIWRKEILLALERGEPSLLQQAK
jgi:AraC family transcriptional regulator of adaptative response/methylated-DNA-[protein]-cysteine methyltransferase